MFPIPKKRPTDQIGFGIPITYVHLRNTIFISLAGAFLESNILKAIQIISKKDLGLGIIIKNKFAIGVVTDGDIRRGAKMFSRKNKITTLMTKKPLYTSENTPASKALSVMSEKKITSLLVSSDKNYKKNKAYFKPAGILHIHSLLKYGIK